jgi:hypothetical protein
MNYIPGSILLRKETKKAKEKAKVTEENISRRKQSHSLAPAM